MGLDKEQLYNLEHNYNLALNRLENSKISKQNKEHVLDFLEHCELNCAELRRIFYIDKLKRAGSFIDKDFKEWDKKDIVSFISYLKDKNYKDGTIDSYMVALKCFFRFIRDCEKGESTPKFLRVMVRKRVTNNLKKEDLIDTEEIKKILNVCRNSRDRCMVSMAFEAGLRTGELRSITISDLIKTSYGYKVYIGENGAKTQYSRRAAHFAASKNYLHEWLSKHPYRHNLKSPLFCNLANGNVLTGQVVTRIIKVAGMRAVGKDLHHYILRHSFGTRMSLNKHPESAIKKLMGHSPTSHVLADYQHLAESDGEDIILNEAGEKTTVKTDETKGFVPQVCASCGHKGSPTDVMCSKCHNVIDPDTFIVQETGMNEGISKDGLTEMKSVFRSMIQEELDKIWSHKEPNR